MKHSRELDVPLDGTIADNMDHKSNIHLFRLIYIDDIIVTGNSVVAIAELVN
jgi:predicted amidophosphoribosyltransferase